jgi:uncharacterized membrane protein YbhN (UPF0104 family)
VRRLLHLLGAAVALGLIGWILHRHLDEAPAVDLGDPEVRRQLATALGLYMASQLLAASAWGRTLAALAALPAPWRAETQLLVGQIGKYLPGNVAHLVGRVALARRDGMSAPTAGLGLVFETVLTLGVAAAIGALGLLLAPGLAERLADEAAPGTLALLAGAAAAAVAVAAALALRFRRQVARAHIRFRPGPLVGAAALQAANFGLLGLSLQAAAAAAAPEAVPSAGTCTALFAVAWAAGLLTPGAPGGLGVRESLLVLGLGLYAGPPAALTAALAHRAVSVAGDAVLFGSGLALRARLNRARTSG